MSQVEITAGFVRPPSEPDAFPGMDGCLRIEVDGLVVTAPADMEDEDDAGLYDARGERLPYPSYEHAGRTIDFNVDDLQEAIAPFLRGDADRHREYVAELGGETGAMLIVFSHLDGDLVRVAGKTRYDEYMELVPMEAAIGAAVDPEAVARELLDCRRSFVEYVERAFEDHDPDLSEDIDVYRSQQREQIEELEAFIGDPSSN